MEKIDIKFKTRFMLGSLRNVGYEPYSALDEFIDNSIDANSKNVSVHLKKGEDGKLSSIMISDIGDGMTLEQLKEALSFGSDSGKTNKTLGVYGTGMKTAALALGQRMIVVTKSSETDKVYIATFDVEELYQNMDAIPQVSYDELDNGKPLYKIFESITKLKSGTIVIIDKLDKLPTYDINTFKGTLISHLRLVYNKYIYDEMVDILVCGEKLTFFDPIGYYNSPMGVKKMDEGIIEDDDVKAKWIAYNIPMNDEYSRDKFPDFYGRTEDKCGIYVYRCNRLVGQHLGFGTFSKNSHHHNGFRLELFLDGNADTIFGTTFNKMIFEKDKSSIRKSFYDKLYNVVNPLANLCAQEQKAKSKGTELDETTKKQLDDVTRSLNDNPRIAIEIKKKGKNKPSTVEKEKNNDKEHKKQQNPNPTKRRVDAWFGGYEFVREGKTTFMYRYDKRDRLYYLIINQDHEWYNQIFSKVDADARNKIASWVALSIVAREKVAYFGDEGKENKTDTVLDIFNQYDEVFADQVRLKFFGEE